jgi:hypothetical protein
MRLIPAGFSGGVLVQSTLTVLERLSYDTTTFQMLKSTAISVQGVDLVISRRIV